MKRTMTFWISPRIARRWGTRAAAVAGWIYAHAQRAALEAGASDGKGRGWVRASQEQIAQELHLCRQTVAKILRTLTEAGILVAANFYTDEQGAERLIEADLEASAAPKDKRCEASAAHKGKARLVKAAAAHKGKRSVGHRLGKANRGYTIGNVGYQMMALKPRQWHIWHEEAFLCCGGISTGVCAKVGVNAAIVFQYLWFWATSYRWGSHYTKNGRACLPYTAAEISRWLPFLSDDVVEAALHTLESEGLLLKLRQGCLTKWSIADAGFIAMGQVPPLQAVPASLVACNHARNVGRGEPIPYRNLLLPKRRFLLRNRFAGNFIAGMPSPRPTPLPARDVRQSRTAFASRMLRVSLRETSLRGDCRVWQRHGQA